MPRVRTNNIRIVAIARDLTHETDKVCFEWDKEPDEVRREEDVLERFGGYKYGFNAIDDNEAYICKVCLWYFEPYCGASGVVEDSMNIWYNTGSGSYHSRMWVGRFLVGEANRAYNQEYGPICTLDLERVVGVLRREIDGAGDADADATKECKRVLEFLERWVGRDDIDVLCIKEGER